MNIVNEQREYKTRTLEAVSDGRGAVREFSVNFKRQQTEVLGLGQWRWEGHNLPATSLSKCCALCLARGS
jgi:hypothetical protein